MSPAEIEALRAKVAAARKALSEANAEWEQATEAVHDKHEPLWNAAHAQWKAADDALAAATAPESEARR